MTIQKLDIDRSEQGVGASKIKAVAGDVFNPTVVRETGFTFTPVPIGEPDGYDASSATAIRLYYDVVLGGAGFLELRIVPMAADPKPGGIPEPKGATADVVFNPDVPVLGADSIVRPQSSGIRFDADRRGSLTFSRPSILFRLEVLTDIPTPDGEIALAIQSVVDGGGE